MRKNHQLINQDSGKFEYFTPPEIVEAARAVMGSIDLDPASTRKANRWIKAGTIYTLKQDGLKQNWFGNVWMNHPFSRKNNPIWINKLLHEYVNGAVSQAICITYASTSEAWFRDLMDFAQCFLYPRTNYCDEKGKKKRGVTKGSVVTYLGNDMKKFIKAFDGHFGTVKL